MKNNTIIESISRILVALPHRKEVVRMRDMVQSTSTHCLGGGEWSIELHEGRDYYSPCIAEFVGRNGSAVVDGVKDDLWAEVKEWENDPKRGGEVHHITHWYTLPDGCEMNFHAILRDVERGCLHGLTLTF